jgi:apolipoprotein D and lipocalin family protein
MKARVALVLLAFVTILACAQRGAPPRTAERVDVERYLGTWYEIASFPSWFQRDCVATQATYSKRDDGQLGVANACREKTLDGEWKRIEGVAWPVEPGDFTKLKVQFFWPLSGDYWVLALDPEYRWALVGHPNRDYLWVLSRTRAIDERRYAEIVALAQAQGYDVTRLRRTLQPMD